MAAERGCARRMRCPSAGPTSLGQLLATARMTARCVGDGVLVDIGSTPPTSSLAPRIVWHTAAPDATRLERRAGLPGRGAHAAVCADPADLFRDELYNVMNEFFATTGGRVPPHWGTACCSRPLPAADNGAKDALGTQRRLARMVGMDAREASPQEWLAFARAWRATRPSRSKVSLCRVPARPRCPLVRH